MALPLGWLGWLSVSGEHGATLAHYRDVFTDLALRKALWNTVVLAFWVGLVSVALGAPLAWLTARTDIPGRGLIRGLVLASFVTPPFLGAFAWVMLAGPNAGILNTLWRSVTGSRESLLNIFTMPGLIFIVAIYTFPYVYIMVANTLALIASDLEEAAAILAAGRLTVRRRQGRPAPHDPARCVAFPGAVRVSGRDGVRDLPALRRAGQGRLRARVGPAAEPRQPHARQFHVHVLRVRRDARCHRQHARAGGDDGVRRRRDGRRAVLRHQPPAGRRPPARRVPGAGAGRGAGRRARRGSVHRLHAAAVRAVRHALDPLPRVPHQGDAGRLRAGRRDVSRDSRRPRGRRKGAGRGAAAHPQRGHGAAGQERPHRRLVL